MQCNELISASSMEFHQTASLIGQFNYQYFHFGFRVAVSMPRTLVLGRPHGILDHVHCCRGIRWQVQQKAKIVWLVLRETSRSPLNRCHLQLCCISQTIVRWNTKDSNFSVLLTMSFGYFSLVSGTAPPITAAPSR